MTDFASEAWVGRSEEVHDYLDHSQLRRIAATLGEAVPAAGEDLPPLWHWAFFQNPLEESCLGEDGHAVQGTFLPPPTNRSRMWAGGRVEFLRPLRVGAEACRHSSIVKVEEKTGATGALLFVTVLHEIRQDGQLAIREEQDIVYRTPAPPKLSSSQPLPGGDWREAVLPTPALLFRYSAVTFNTHRIHYDWPYVTEAEGYPGLVVHGPLIATLSLRAFCRANPESRVKRFAYRGLRPLIAPQPFEVGGRIRAAGIADGWAGNAAGLAQQSEIHFE